MLTCTSCGAQPPPDLQRPGDTPQGILTRLADALCPRGGAGCPHTSSAVTERDQLRPRKLKVLIDAARDRLPRTRRLVLPALAANTPLGVPVVWGDPLPDDTYAIGYGVIAGAALLGRIEITVQPGSILPTGCMLLVAATRDVTAGQAGLHVVATP